MSGSILNKARRDAQRFTESGGFETDITLTASGGQVETVRGWAMKHHVSIDAEGQLLNSLNARITLTEGTLNAVDYPVRDAKNNVAMKNHLVEWEDLNGVTKTYIIKENWPDETLGLITFNLGNYAS